MKGKGKGERGAAASNAEKDKEKECPLQFPDMKPVDHARLCPRYSAVLSRSLDDGIGIEEADTLQTELETLLASVAKRMRVLEGEIKSVSSWGDGKGSPAPPVKESKSKGKGQPEGKRGGKGSDDKSAKKFKDSSGKSSLPPGSKAKGKAQSFKQSELPEFPDSPKPPEVPRMVPKNDVPNRFWTMIEPYCSDISKEDLNVLEEIMRSHEDDVEYHKIPALGKHYSHKWAAEDMLEEQREGIKPNEKRRSVVNSNNSSANDNHKRGTNNSEDVKESDFLLPLDINSDDDSSPFGPLTQRLVSALIEENIMTPLDDGSIEVDAAEAATMSPRSLAKQLNIGNATQLERRIKKELEDQGILEIEERPDDNPEDEILSEMRRKQHELRALSHLNQQATKRLYKLSKEEMARQDIRKKLAAADADVLDAYRKIQAARQKRKQPTKKERDIALRALKEREALIRQLEG